MKDKKKRKHYKYRDHIYEDMVGNRKSFSVYYKGNKRRFRNKSEANRYLAELRNREGDYTENTKNELTFAEMSELLIDELKRENKKYSTYVTKQQILTKRIIPNFTNKKLKDITKIDCIEFRDWLADQDLSTTTKNSTLVIFKQVFNFADEKYDVENRYARKLKKYKVTEEEQAEKDKNAENVWEPEEFNVFIGKIYSLFYITMFTFMITAWTRLGETLAIHWSDYDPKKKEVYIHRNIMKVSAKEDPRCFKEVTPKTKNSKRYIILNDTICNLLNKLKEAQKNIPGFNEEWYIFNRWDGSKHRDGTFPMSRTCIYRVFDEGIKKSGVKKIRIHDLRHSGATHAIISGEDIKAVSERLGHSDIQITLEVYHHAIERTKTKLMNNTNDFTSFYQLQ